MPGRLEEWGSPRQVDVVRATGRQVVRLAHDDGSNFALKEIHCGR